MKKVFLWSVAIVVSAPVIAGDIQITHPVIDASCSEYEQLNAESKQLAPGLTLYSFQNEGYVWFCYTKPADSHGTADVYIDTEKLDEPLNLHVSAQLGEWPAEKPDSSPDRSTSDEWWEVDGWWANTVAFNGIPNLEEGEEGVVKFKAKDAREIVLQKSRFGKGTWKLKFEIGDIKVGDERKTINYPALDAENSIWEFPVN